MHFSNPPVGTFAWLSPLSLLPMEILCLPQGTDRTQLLLGRQTLVVILLQTLILASEHRAPFLLYTLCVVLLHICLLSSCVLLEMDVFLNFSVHVRVSPRRAGPGIVVSRHGERPQLLHKCKGVGPRSQDSFPSPALGSELLPPPNVGVRTSPVQLWSQDSLSRPALQFSTCVVLG